jgi:hypothetical protein
MRPIGPFKSISPALHAAAKFIFAAAIICPAAAIERLDGKIGKSDSITGRTMLSVASGASGRLSEAE